MRDQRELLFLNSIIEKEHHTIFLEVNFGNIKFVDIKTLKVFNQQWAEFSHPLRWEMNSP